MLRRAAASLVARGCALLQAGGAAHVELVQRWARGASARGVGGAQAHAGGGGWGCTKLPCDGALRGRRPVHLAVQGRQGWWDRGRGGAAARVAPQPTAAPPAGE